MIELKMSALILVWGAILLTVDCQGQRTRFRRPQQVQQQFVEEPEYATLSLGQRERLLVEADKTLRVREDQVDFSARAYSEREAVLEKREEALEARDINLDQRSRDLDRRILDTDKRLKEREARIARRESELAAKEREILKTAEIKEQEIERLSRERESQASERERALLAREVAVQEKERVRKGKTPPVTPVPVLVSPRLTSPQQYQNQNHQYHTQRVGPRPQRFHTATSTSAEPAVDDEATVEAPKRRRLRPRA